MTPETGIPTPASLSIVFTTLNRHHESPSCFKKTLSYLFLASEYCPTLGMQYSATLFSSHFVRP
jgi:hypothetical protein